MGASRDFSITSYQSFGDVTTFDGLSSFTVAYWVNYDTQSNDQGGVCGKYQNFGSFSWYILTENSNLAFAVRQDNSNVLDRETDTDLSVMLATGVWGFFALTFTADTSVFYLNGSLQASHDVDVTGTVTTLMNTPGDYLVGAMGSAFGLDGKLAYLQIFNKVLSVAEITQVMWQPGSIRSGLLSYVPCMDTSTTERDLVRQATSSSTGTNSSNISGPPIKGVFF